MLKEKFSTALKTSMIEKDEVKIRTYRSIIAKITEEEKKTGKAISDDDILKVVEKAAKQRQESMLAFQKASRSDLFEIENHEFQILKEFLPSKLDADQTRALLVSIIESGSNNIGLVMKELSKHGNSIDKKLASDILKELM